jgi:hypothetical protein
MITVELDTSVIPPRVVEALTEPTNPIHSTTPVGQQAMNVGVRVRLTLDTDGGSLTNVAGIVWSISGGDAIKDYDISSLVGTPANPQDPEDPQGNIRGHLTRCDTIPLELADLQGTNQISFYFTNPGTFVVTVVAEIDGTPEVGTMTFNVQRDAKAEIYYVTGGSGFEIDHEDRDNILGEHFYWHEVAEDTPGFAFDNPGRFFHFHRGFIEKFNCWRSIFGYPCVPIYVSGPNHLHSGREVDHAGQPGEGNGIVNEERHPDLGNIQRLPARFTIDGDGNQKLEDYVDANDLYDVIGYHNTQHGRLCGFGDFYFTETTPADPIFWQFHFFLTKLLELNQTLRLDGEILNVGPQESPGGTQVFYPDPKVTIIPDCKDAIPTAFTPASGHLFPVGETIVTATAVDLVLLDPHPEPNAADQEATVGSGTTKNISFTVNVMASTADPIPADIHLVLDDTFSMHGATPAGPGGETPEKIEALKDSMATLMSILDEHRNGVGDNIGAFTFKVPPGEPSTGCEESWRQELVSFGPLEERVQNDAALPFDINDAVAGMAADGIATPLSIAVSESSDNLAVQPAGRKRWIILLTDGKQNTMDCLVGSVKEPAYNDQQVVNFRNKYLAQRGTNLLAVGFGGGNAINGPLLRTLAAGPDDYFDYAAEGPGSLNKWFTAAVARILNQAEVIDPAGVLNTGDVVTQEVPLTRTCRSATFILSWAEGGLRRAPTFCVQSPDAGAQPITITEDDHDPEAGITWIAGRSHKILVLRFPLTGDNNRYHRGTWTALVCGPGISGTEESTSYTFAAISDEALRLRCHLPDREIRTREAIPFKVVLEGDSVQSATVTVEVIPVQNSIGTKLVGLTAEEKKLAEAGTHSEANAGLMERRMDVLGMKEAALAKRLRKAPATHKVTLKPGERKPGNSVFTGELRAVARDGAYSVAIRVEGVTLLGDRFVRECSMGFYAAATIKATREVHLKPVEGIDGVFDWIAKPASDGMFKEILGPGFAHEFEIKVGGGTATSIVDHDDGTVSTRITLDAGVPTANVAVFFKRELFTEFQVPLATEATSLTPDSGPEAGGTAVSIHGKEFRPEATVVFGSDAVEIEEINKTRSKIIVTSPPGKGVVSVRVMGTDGSVAAANGGFTYVAPEPPDDRCCGEDGKNPSGIAFKSPDHPAKK